MNNELPLLALDLCRLLPGGWIVRPTNQSWHTQLARADGAVLWIGTGRDSSNSKWSICSSVDIEHAHGYLPGREKFPGIQVSRSKSAATIAKDIQRRILPKFEPLLAIVLKRQAESDAHTALTITNAKRLAPLVGRDVPNMTREGCGCEMSNYLDEVKHARVTVNGNRVDVTISDLTVDEAEAILQIANGLQTVPFPPFQ